MTDDKHQGALIKACEMSFLAAMFVVPRGHQGLVCCLWEEALFIQQCQHVVLFLQGTHKANLVKYNLLQYGCLMEKVLHLVLPLHDMRNNANI